MIDQDIYKQIEELAESSTEDIFYALLEEVGELSLCLHVNNGTKRRSLKEPAEVEVIDVILVAIELYIKLGGKFEDLDRIGRAKLQKWMVSVEANKHIQFEEHLKKADEIVKGWPDWKQKCLGAVINQTSKED